MGARININVKKLFFRFFILALFSVIACLIWQIYSDKHITNQYNSETIENLSAKQVMENYFYYWNKKDESNYLKLLTANEKNQHKVSSLNMLRYVKLQSIEESASDNGYMQYGRGLTVKPYNLKTYEVKFEIRFFGHGEAGLENGEYTWYYNVIKTKANSPWQIDDYGR